MTAETKVPRPAAARLATEGASQRAPTSSVGWNWTHCHLPADGEVVDTKIDDEKSCRNEQRLRRRGRLWFTEDDAMYVYYTPTHWKLL